MEDNGKRVQRRREKIVTVQKLKGFPEKIFQGGRMNKKPWDGHRPKAFFKKDYRLSVSSWAGWAGGFCSRQMRNSLSIRGR